MSYQIFNADGTLFATIPDGTINTSSSLVLVGKNWAGYGDYLNTNSLRLLQNSASGTAPSAPVRGQLWWNQTTRVMSAYDGSQFKRISGASSAAAANPPTAGATTGDLWFDTTNEQLRLWNGSTWILIGPESTPGSGAVVTTIVDSGSNPHVVVQLLVSNTIVSMISKDSVFTPQTTITGFANVRPGIQISSSLGVGITGLFQGTASNAELLDNLNSTQFLRSDVDDSTSGTLSILNNTGLAVGVDSDFRVLVSGSTVNIRNATSDGDLNLQVNDGGVTTTVISATGATGAVTFPAAAGVSVTGNVAGGNLTTAGSVTATGNVAGGNLTTAGSVTATGNVAGDYILGNGSQLTGISSGSAITSGTSEVAIIAPNGNVRATINSSPIQTISTSGVSVTGAITASGAVTGSGFVGSGATLTNLNMSNAASGTLSVARGGTGASTLTSGSVLVGAGTSAVTAVAPGTNGNVLTVSGGAWVSQAPSGGGGGIVRQRIFRYNNTINQSTTSGSYVSFVGLGWTSDIAGASPAALSITTTGSSRVQLTLYTLVQLDSGGSPGTYTAAVAIRDSTPTELRGAFPQVTVPEGEYFVPLALAATTGTLSAATHTFTVDFYRFSASGTVGLGGTQSVLILEEYEP